MSPTEVIAVVTPLYDQVQLIEKKECRHCYQEIDARADRCPFCQIDQSSSAKGILHLISILATVVAVGAVGYATHNLNELDLAVTEREVAITQRDDALRSLQEVVAEVAAQAASVSTDDSPVTPSPEILKMKMLQASSLLLSSCESRSDSACQAALAAMAHSTADFSDSQAKRLSCSEGREVLLNLVGASSRIANVFNEIHESASSCRS
jgi:hypothetical protein